MPSKAKAVTRDEQARQTYAVYAERPDYDGYAYSFWRDTDGQLYELRYDSPDSELEVTVVDDAGHPIEG